MLNLNFKILLSESHFTHDILCSGITHIGKVSYDKKGYYFTSFSAIGTGLERLGKLCYLVDYFIENNQFPTYKILKKDIGHDILKLYEYSKKIVVKNQLTFEFNKNLDDEIYIKALTILTNFAKGDRYTNIDLLTNSPNQSKPISDWYNLVEMYIFKNKVPKKVHDRIKVDAESIERLIGGSSSAIYIDENNEILRSISATTFRTGVAHANSKFRILLVSQIVRYFVEILVELQYIAVQRGLHDIPYFNEVFSIFINDDKYLISRKNFERQI